MFWFQTVLKRFETPGHLLSVRTLMCVECQLFIIVLKLQRETEKMTMNIFLSLTRYRVSIILPLIFFASDQRLVSQCPVQPSCRRHEVPGWKTDCAYHWTVLYLPADLLYNARKSPCSCKQPSHHHDSITYNFEYHVRRWSF